MIKNKKGFTLVELLAAIVILGILSVFAIPVITQMVQKSRNKMYIDDAKKLVARAEYQMKASSTSIDKPDNGNCIIISMAYLQASEITSAPNGGEYDEDQSYVVIRNNEGKLDYAVALVEDLPKGGYKGIPLSPFKEVINANANSKVVEIESSELVDIEEIKAPYIRSKLGNAYLAGNVTAIYHYHEIKDSSVHVVTTSAPIIQMARVQEVSPLEVEVSVTVKDDDTNNADLTIYYSVGSEALENQASFGSNTTRKFTINLKQAPYNYQVGVENHIDIYITVRDPEGEEGQENHSASRKLTYTSTGNNPPSIDTLEVSKHPSDVNALARGIVTISVSDDFDQPNQMSICTTDSMEDGLNFTCDNYQSYSSYVHDGIFGYEFVNCDGGVCPRDGQTHYLKVAVKDSMGQVTKASAPYVISENKNPELISINVQSISDGAPSWGNKNVLVTVRASDDGSLNHLKVHISSALSVTQQYNYSEDNNQNTFSYLLSGNYNGETKTISVYVTDDEGGTSNTLTQDYQLYANEAPDILYFNVRSDGVACNYASLCPTEDGGSKNGSLNAIIEFGVYDEVEQANNYADVKVCFSETASYCDTASHFEPYSNYRDQEIHYAFEGSYNGTSKKMYLFVKDSSGNIADAEATYTLYKDSKPTISDFKLTPSVDIYKVSEDDEEEVIQFNSKDAYIQFYALDDFTSENQLLFTMKKDGVVVIDKQPITNFYENKPIEGSDPPAVEKVFNYLYHVADLHQGQTYHFDAYVTDNKGYESDTLSLDYTIYDNTGPQTEGNPSVQKAPTSYDVGDYLQDIYFYQKFVDDYDVNFNVRYCYSLNQNLTNPVCMEDTVQTTEVYHLTDQNLFKNLSYSGQNLYVYAIAYDSLDPTLTAQSAAVHMELYNANDGPTIDYAYATHKSTVQGNSIQAPIVFTIDFLIHDLFDTYQVCFSTTNNASSCTNYIGSDGTSNTTFDGSSNEMNQLTYSVNNNLSVESKIYLFAKGTTDGVTSSATVDISKYGTCVVKDYSNPRYTYRHSGSGQALSKSRCSNNCYHYSIGNNNTNHTTSQYYVKISYLDKYNPASSCPDFEGEETLTAKYCDFIDCFKNGTTYNQIAIGTYLIHDSTPWTEEIDGVTYINYDHYKSYSSSYQEGNKNITLARRANNYSSFGLKENRYSSQFTNGYVRVADYDD